MLNRLIATLSLLNRRLDSAEHYTADLRSDALLNGRTQGFAAAAATRW